MGLTQSVGGEGLKFEVWVRQAPRTRDCVTLQAKDAEDKAAWTRDIAHLLWTHAINNTGTLRPLTLKWASAPVTSENKDALSRLHQTRSGTLSGNDSPPPAGGSSVCKLKKQKGQQDGLQTSWC